MGLEETNGCPSRPAASASRLASADAATFSKGGSCGGGPEQLNVPLVGRASNPQNGFAVFWVSKEAKEFDEFRCYIYLDKFPGCQLLGI